MFWELLQTQALASGGAGRQETGKQRKQTHEPLKVKNQNITVRSAHSSFTSLPRPSSARAQRTPAQVLSAAISIGTQSKPQDWVKCDKKCVLNKILPEKQLNGDTKPNLGKHCRDWEPGKTQTLVDETLKQIVGISVCVYTDGAVQKHHSGWSYVTVKDGKPISTGYGGYREEEKSLEMEAEAMTHAIQWICSNTDKIGNCVVLLTDCLNIIKGKIAKGLVKADWNLLLNTLGDNFKMYWMYVPAHAGVTHTDCADELAKNACRKFLSPFKQKWLRFEYSEYF